jgi:hypothetical protein
MFKIKKQMVKYSLRILVPFSLLSIFALPALMNTPVHALSSSDFVTTWKTDNPGVSNSTSITVPMIGVDNYSVDWNNDGIFDETGLNGSTTHDFGSAGTYTIRISAPTARIYFGNNGDKDKILNISQWGTTAWTDFSDAFGYEETKDKNGPETFKTFVKELGLDKEEAADRTRQQGKEPDPKKHKIKLQNVPKKIRKQKGFIDKMTISEKSELENIKKQQVVDMVEDIVLGKKSSDKEVGKKKNTLSKLLMKNLENIKKIADKEGIEINDLVKILKK